MQKGTRNSPAGHWWVGTLFGAEEIPAAIVTYVAMLMFLQADAGAALATGYCGLLFLPWVLKSFMRQRVRRLGYFRLQLQWLELSLVLLLMLLAFVFVGYYPRVLTYHFSIFANLFLISLLTAWHELAARMYYERMFRPRLQRLFNGPKIVASQSAAVLTYGLLIMFVGALQVIYRRIPRSWNEGCYLAAGLLLIFALWHLYALRRPPVGDPHLQGSAMQAVKAEIEVIDRIRRKPYWLRCVGVLALLLLPQGLMFYSRVLFLLSPTSGGGLGCTLIDLGFAQGTIGVIAFSVGLLLGRQLVRWVEMQRVFWWMAVALGLSPLIYLLMTFEPPTSLLTLCMATLQAQFFFGFGLNLAMHFVRYISGERYRNTINYLYIPLIAFVLLPPMALSGWLVTELGFRYFFLLDALLAPLAWLVAWASRCRFILS